MMTNIVTKLLEAVMIIITIISINLLVNIGIMGDFLKLTASSSFTDFSLTVIK